MKCNQDYREIAGARVLKRLPRATEEKFVHLAIYEYLHICYFQVGITEIREISSGHSSPRLVLDVIGTCSYR